MQMYTLHVHMFQGYVVLCPDTSQPVAFQSVSDEGNSHRCFNFASAIGSLLTRGQQACQLDQAILSCIPALNV